MFYIRNQGCRRRRIAEKRRTRWTFLKTSVVEDWQNVMMTINDQPTTWQSKAPK